MPAQSQVRDASAEHEEVSRVVRFSRPVALPEPSEGKRSLERLDVWAAFAVVVLASSAMLYAASWMLANWQLR